MNSTVTLRQARESDRPFLYELHVATMREYVAQTWVWEDGVQRRMFDERFDPAAIQVIELEGQPIGMQVVSASADAIEVGNIEILPRFQGRGIGTRLIREIIATARQTRRPLRLQVLRVNPARTLYERLGFRVTAETQTHVFMEIAPS